MLALFLLLVQKPSGNAPGVALDAHLAAGRYLSALAEAELTEGVDEPGSMLMDQLGLLQSYVSLERETLRTFDAMGEAPGAAALTSSPLDAAQALDAIPAIVAAARGKRIVILNESHHMPRHRAFAAELARALRAEGFTWFGAEAFADIAGTVKRGYPSADTGYYVREPVFGELVRTVLALGYRTFAYEAEALAGGGSDARTRINQRETQQAANIVQRCFDVDPEARVFLYVGYSHATETWRDRAGPDELAWMAARLAALTGLDPLTIDQTETMPHSDEAHANPHWLRARAQLDGPKVFQREDGSFIVVGSYAGSMDLQVFHPPLGVRSGRPDWLARGRTAIALPPELAGALAPDVRLLAQAFRASEPPNAIPSDQFVVVGTQGAASFLLPRGRYRLVLVDEEGEVRARVEGIDVP